MPAKIAALTQESESMKDTLSTHNKAKMIKVKGIAFEQYSMWITERIDIGDTPNMTLGSLDLFPKEIFTK